MSCWGCECQERVIEWVEQENISLLLRDPPGVPVTLLGAIPLPCIHPPYARTQLPFSGKNLQQTKVVYFLLVCGVISTCWRAPLSSDVQKTFNFIPY
jgi:hypothetical protein